LETNFGRLNFFMANKLICSGRNVLYAGAAVPQPATITINTETGKITEILPSYQTQGSDEDGGIIWIDAGDKLVLPGLVECVVPSTRKSGDISGEQCPCPLE
jgi:imidazolonepropionase-like amidohydrolase